MRYLVSVFLFLLALTCVHAEAKFDFATTPGKLPKEVRPTEYAIRIVPDLDKLTFDRLGLDRWPGASEKIDCTRRGGADAHAQSA
jgi:hypothetical protein